MKLVVFALGFLFFCVWGSAAMPQPDEFDAERSYGEDSGNVNSGVVDSLFGINQPSAKNPGAPKKVKGDDKYDKCNAYALDGYSCVPYYQCKDGLIITDGGGLIDIRSSLVDVQLDPDNSKCEGYLEVCCRDEDWDGLPLTPVSTERPSTYAPIIKTTTPTPPTPYTSKCGKRNTYGIDVRIVNRENSTKHKVSKASTQFGEWPHMCAVLNKSLVSGEELNLYACGGSLIAPNVILTAAHCVAKLDVANIKVRCGEWDTQKNIEPIAHQDRYAKHVSIHPEFNGENLHNDFALIHLESPFYLDSHIDTICLPSSLPGSQYKRPYLTEGCVATGWGKDKFGKDGEYQVILKQVKMDMVDHEDCQEKLRVARLGGRFILDDSFVCAGGKEGQDTCKGDGGGPLVCPTIEGVPPEHQTYVQSGITAWGIGCGSETPGVYANVADAMCFIDWATRCQEGQQADYYGQNGCQWWAKRAFCSYKEKRDLYTNQISSAQTPKAKNKARKLKKIAVDIMSKYRACTGHQNLNCNNQDYLDDKFSDNVLIKSSAVEAQVDPVQEEDTQIRDGSENLQ